ncbi:MAG: hypothetical protein AAFV33_03580 [Chloroflexota bacterium]
MNTFVQQQFPVLDQTLALRYQLLDIISDDDLKFALPGNMTLGELCKQVGEFDYVYAQAFKTGKHEWDYTHADTSVAESVEKLRGWYTELETDIKDTVAAMTDEQINTTMIDRGHEMAMPFSIDFFVYRESLLIFCAKASLYLRALGKPLPRQWQTWIG